LGRRFGSSLALAIVWSASSGKSWTLGLFFGLLLAEFGRALSLNPDFHFANLHLGDGYFRLGRYREAAAQYQRFLKLAPSNWDAAVGNHRLTLLYLKQGDLQQAEQAATQELKYKNNLGGTFLVALAKGDLQTAAIIKEDLFERRHPPLLFPKTVSFYRGCYAMKRGNADEAIEHFNAALGRPPLVWNVDGIEDCLANAYLEAGQVDASVAEYERLLSINPNYPLAHYHLAQAFEQKGEVDKARAAYKRFLQIWKDADPQAPEIIRSRRYLNE
jgi:tetratricopeptide (TPR) repeat protein